jgi:hypothetical protein
MHIYLFIPDRENTCSSSSHDVFVVNNIEIPKDIITGLILQLVRFIIFKHFKCLN